MFVRNGNVAGCLIKIERSEVWKWGVNYFLFVFQRSSFLLFPFFKFFLRWFNWNRIRNASNLVDFIISKTWNMDCILILKLFSSDITVKRDLLFVSKIIWKWIKSITYNISMLWFPTKRFYLNDTNISR